MADPGAILPIALVIAVTMLAGVICNAGIWFVVIKIVRGVASWFGLHLWLAVRQLGGRRSGYISATALVAMWGISASSCNLITTLSVMGGFGEDLKRKILGMKSHVVVDRPGGEIIGEDLVMERISTVDGVIGISPYVQGEVMVRSAINIAGAVLRGVDPEKVCKVTNLGQSIEEGSILYLTHPERILSDSLYGRGTRKGWNDDSEVERPDPGRGPPPGSAGETKPTQWTEGGSGGRPLTKLIQDSLRDAGKGGDEAEGQSEIQLPVHPGVVVGREMSKNLNLYRGDEVKLISPLGEIGPTGPMPKSRPYRVAAIFFSGMYEYDAKNVYVTLESGRKFLGIDRGVTGIEVKVSDPDDVERVTAEIQKVLGPLGGELRVRHWKELNRSLFSALLLEKIGMFIMLSVIVLIAYLIIITTLYMMVMEKTGDIAVLKTLGCSEASIYRIFQIEGLILGLSGTFTGVGLGVAQTLGLKHFGVPLNPDVHYISQLPVQIRPVEVAIVGVASLVICLLITVLPARRASRLTVVDGLRFK